jgi:hypothetical protein
MMYSLGIIRICLPKSVSMCLPIDVLSGCKYVENLVWFKKTLSNVLQDRPSPYFSSSKEILLIFKKGDGFELRHQRTADVIIDFERPTEQWIHEGNLYSLHTIIVL